MESKSARLASAISGLLAPNAFGVFINREDGMPL